MRPERLVEMIEATFTYFGSLGTWYQDPAGVEAVREVRGQMVRDLAGFSAEPCRSELAESCRKWRRQRIEWEGLASYPLLNRRL